MLHESLGRPIRSCPAKITRLTWCVICFYLASINKPLSFFNLSTFTVFTYSIIKTASSSCHLTERAYHIKVLSRIFPLSPTRKDNLIRTSW